MRMRTYIGAVLLVATGVGLGVADDTAPNGTPNPDSDVVVTGRANAQVSVQDMTARADQMLTQMEAASRALTDAQLSARHAKDVIKLNCINDKLLQVKQLLNLAENARAGIDSGSDDERAHAYAQITIANENVASQAAPGSCLGEGDIYVGASSLTVTVPRIVDDPTTVDPFNLAGLEIERPTYATPFL